MWETEMSQFVNSVWAGILSAGSEIGTQLVSILPGVIAAIIILVVGWLVAVIIGKIVKKGLEKIKLDMALKERGLEKALGKASLTNLLATLSKWYVFVIFLNQAAQLIALTALQAFLQEVLFYLPALFGAALVVIVGLLAGEYLKNSIKEMQVPYYDFFGSFTKFIVFYVSLVIGLQTAGFDATILINAFNIGLMGLVLTVAIAVGIGFGLAIKDEAKRIVKGVKKKL